SLSPSSLCSTLFPYTTLFRSYAQPFQSCSILLAYGVQVAKQMLANRERSRVSLESDFSYRLELNFHPDCVHNQTLDLSQSGWKRSEEHTSELQSRENLVCRLL